MGFGYRLYPSYELNGSHSVFPFHGIKEIPAPLVNSIKKDLGLK
jgi:mRNA interferase HicA